MSGVCEQWSLEELVAMTEKDMDGVLSYYESGKVPTLQEAQK
jgi:precorrin-2 dehydrogenase/sirohydrochlorin ferrochelatase